MPGKLYHLPSGEHPAQRGEDAQTVWYLYHAEGKTNARTEPFATTDKPNRLCFHPTRGPGTTSAARPRATWS